MLGVKVAARSGLDPWVLAITYAAVSINALMKASLTSQLEGLAAGLAGCWPMLDASAEEVLVVSDGSASIAISLALISSFAMTLAQ